MNQKPTIQVSKKYMDVVSRERCHRILNPNPVWITPGIYVIEKNQKQKIVFRQLEVGVAQPTPPKFEDLSRELRDRVPSFGLPRAKPLPGEFEQMMVLPYGGNTAIYQNKFDRRFSQYLSSCFGQAIEKTIPHFLIDVDLLRQVIEVPAPQPGWFFRLIRLEPNPIFCFVVPHEFDFRLALVALLINFDDVGSL